MLGTMQDWELRVSALIDYAAREHATREIVTHWADGTRTRTNWATVRSDALKMVQALRRLDIYPGDRIATLGMNHARHLVSWFGATGAGCVLHTVNPRLFDDQLDYIINHARDRVLLYDAAFQPLVDRMKSRWPTIEHYICFDSADHAPAFEDWIGSEDGAAIWSPGDDLLHQRHHRASQGRALHAPFERTAHAGDDRAGMPGRGAAFLRAAHRAHVPCQQLGPALVQRGDRREDGL